MKGIFDIEQYRKEVGKQVSVLLRSSETFKNALRYNQVILNEHDIEFYFEKRERV